MVEAGESHAKGKCLSVGLMLPTAANTDTHKVEPARLLNAARLAEQAGFDGVYVGDHLLHPNPLLESIVSLGVVAAVTKEIDIGTCVLLAALRDPLWLAKQLGTLEAYAPGRLRVGIGLGGEYAAEFDAAGVPLKERGQATEQAVKRLRQWMNGSGPAFADDRMTLGIRPVPAIAPPILMAGWKDVALRRAVRIGDGWIGYLLSADSFARRRDKLIEFGAGEHRPFVTGMLLPVHLGDEVAPSKAEAAAFWNRITGNDAVFPEKLFLAGPPTAIADQLAAYADRGCSEVMLGIVDQGDAFDRQLDILASKVVPLARQITVTTGGGS